MLNCSDILILTKIKHEYACKSEVCMSEFLRSYPDVSVEIKRELLAWAGEDDIMMVTDDGEIVSIVEEVYCSRDFFRECFMPRLPDLLKDAELPFQEDLLKTSSDELSEKWKEEIRQFKSDVNKDIEEEISSRHVWGDPVIVISRNDDGKMIPVITTTIDELSIQLQEAFENFKLASLYLSDAFENLSSLADSPDEDENPSLTDSQIRKMLKYEKNPMRIKQLNKMLSGKRGKKR